MLIKSQRPATRQNPNTVCEERGSVRNLTRSNMTRVPSFQERRYSVCWQELS
jgi:hypothetical protein